MLRRRPLGGSVTTLSERCSTPSGKRSVGSVVSHRRKSLCGLRSFSRIFSRVLSQRGSRWQFCSMIHRPRCAPVSMNSCALGPMPWPSAMYLSLDPGRKPMSSPSRNTSKAGSAPGDRMKTMGVASVDCL